MVVAGTTTAMGKAAKAWMATVGKRQSVQSISVLVQFVDIGSPGSGASFAWKRIALNVGF
jgi:hypothetical protein